MIFSLIYLGSKYMFIHPFMLSRKFNIDFIVKQPYISNIVQLESRALKWVHQISINQVTLQRLPLYIDYILLFNLFYK